MSPKSPRNQIERLNLRSSLNHKNRFENINSVKNMNRTNTLASTKFLANTNRVSHLSNQELELKLKDLVGKERNLLHIILEHIREVATRRLYLERAYPSLFEYLVKELGYSGSAAMRRIEAARLLKEVPIVAQKIQEGSLNLSQIGELSRAIKEKEKITGEKISALRKETLVTAISGKSTQETQKELCCALDIKVKEQEKQRVQKDDSVRLELTLSKEQYEKLSQCRDLLAHVLQQNQKDSSWASVIETLAEQYLNKKRVVGKAQGNSLDIDTAIDANINTNAKTDSNSQTDRNPPLDALKAKTNLSPAKVTADAATGCSNGRLRSSHNSGDCCRVSDDRRRGGEIPRARVSQSLTPKMKATILKRDRCCQFEDPLTQKKCGSTFGLQIDHRTPLWAGGHHAEANLQVLCQWHNRLKYQKEAGIHFV